MAGLVGINYGKIENCYNTGGVRASGFIASGICTQSAPADNTGDPTIINCYNLGNVSESSVGAGSGIASTGSKDGYVKNSYYLIDAAHGT